MPKPVPELEATRPGPLLRLAGVIAPGVRQVTAQIEPYTQWWNEQNRQAMSHDGPLLAVIGDSTAIGIGASSPGNGYVGRLVDLLSRRDGHPWAAVNLAQSGARVADGVERQLPAVLDLDKGRRPPSLILSCIGTNDVVWSLDTSGTRRRLTELMAGLPQPALSCLVAGGSPRARAINRGVRIAGRELDVDVVNPWAEPGPSPVKRLAADRFHPNDLGYALMANAIARHLQTPLIEIASERDGSTGSEPGADSAGRQPNRPTGREDR